MWQSYIGETGRPLAVNIDIISKRVFWKNLN
jgi:hypothetical protein